MQLFMSRKDKAPELLYLTTLFTQLILLKTLNECLENNRALQYRGKIRQGWENTMYLLLRSIVLLLFFSKFIDNKDKKNLENYLFILDNNTEKGPLLYLLLRISLQLHHYRLALCSLVTLKITPITSIL